jgi:hypothetical protein
MNALEIIDRVRSLGADVYVEESRLMVRGAGEPLPDDLRQALKESKAEILVALGEPMDEVLRGVLEDIRPHLAKELQQLPAAKLAILVNWHIIAAWNHAARSLKQR